MKQKILALLLVLAVAISIFPMAAMAECAHNVLSSTLGAYSHQQVCADCGEMIVPEEPHYDDDGDGFCDADFCGWDMNRDHLCIPDANCKCQICGETCHLSAYEALETTHKKYCTVCGQTILEEPHSLDANGICVYCRYGCSHGNLSAQSKDQNYHQAYCPDCYLYFDVSEHTLNSAGVCSVCGYAPCSDTHTFGTFGYSKHVCQKCTYTTPCEDANLDCICDICGEENHTVTTIGQDENYHWWPCDLCGSLGEKWPHSDKDKDGLCDICEYQINGGSKPVDPQPEEPKPDVPKPPLPTGDEVYEGFIPMYRLYNPNSGEHFYTGSAVEVKDLDAAGWRYEGIAWQAPKEGDPVYRLFNPNSKLGDHHFTPSEEERDMLVEAGWKLEGTAWLSAPASAENDALHRLYNPNADSGSHHYTNSVEERDNLVKAGWKYEGIGWYGLK